MLIHICYAVYVIEKRLLIDSNYEDLIKNLFNIQKYKESINDVLGIFPFLWFCELFSSTCLRLTYFAINKQNDPTFYGYLLKSLTQYICMCFINLFYLLAINYFQTHRPTVNELLEKYEKTNILLKYWDLQYNVLLNQKVQFYSQTKYMAFNVFEIDLNFLFVFLGSVITFTVMLIQILNT